MGRNKRFAEVESLEPDEDEEDIAGTLHVTVSGGRPPPQREIFVKMPPLKPGDGPTLVDLSKVEDLKDVAEEMASMIKTFGRLVFKGLRGAYRLFSVDCLFIVETTPAKIPFNVGIQELVFEVINRGGHVIYYATGNRIRPCCSAAPREFKINLFDFDGGHVCLFDMEKSFCKYKTRVHSPAVKFGSIRYSGCTMRSPFFRIRNKHLRTDFVAYPLKAKKTWSIPHEYVVMGVTADAKVAHVGKCWPEDDFPIVAQRSLNKKKRMYGVVYEEHLMMYQKLNLLALVFAIKFIRRDFDKPVP